MLVTVVTEIKALCSSIEWLGGNYRFCFKIYQAVMLEIENSVKGLGSSTMEALLVSLHMLIL